MSGTWGKCIHYSIFGESHGGGLGMVIDGLPPGISLDLEEIKFEMDRRRPGKTALETPRNEADEFEICSGYFNDKTTGTPMTVIIRNTNQKSRDYDAVRHLLRPGHADYTVMEKYKGHQDYRGGGHSSGRLTAPIVFSGAVAKQILKTKGIMIGSHISQIGGILDSDFDKVHLDEKTLLKLTAMDFPVLDESKAREMKDRILEAKKEGDSIGGTVEAAVIHLPVGLGNPFFDSVESHLAHLMFSIPAVKGIEFGTGFEMAAMKGSEANDPFYFEQDKIKTKTNHNGGILGGITNGMPLIFKVAFKPTPSISKLQRTVDMQSKKEVEISIEGRHDPCIVPRAVPVVEAMAAMGVLELLMGNG